MEIVIELDEKVIIDNTIDQYIDYVLEIDIDELFDEDETQEFKLTLYSTLKNSKEFKDHLQKLCSDDCNLEDRLYEEIDVMGLVKTLVKNLPVVKKAENAYKELNRKESEKYKKQQLDRLHKEAKNAGFKLVKL
jgi:hypothetical protein